MKKITLSKLLSVAMLIFMASPAASIANDPGQGVVLDKINRMIIEIEKETSWQKQLPEVTSLAYLVRENKDVVDTETIDNLIRLFEKEDGDFTIRKWVARALGEVGPRASRAIPVLKAALDAALDDENCEWRSQSAIPPLVTALKKLGATVENPCEVR